MELYVIQLVMYHGAASKTRRLIKITFLPIVAALAPIALSAVILVLAVVLAVVLALVLTLTAITAITAILLAATTIAVCSVFGPHSLGY
jgi:hypothetical protein